VGRFYTSVEREMYVTQWDNRGPDNLAELCREAVECFGDDWARIRAYVAERIALMPLEDQRRLKDEVSRLLSFRAPSRPSVLH
jgi:hypothetical protein